MAKYTKTAKVNIPMCMAAVLLCLTLISMHLTSGLYARYITSGAGIDSARVITFGDLTLTEEGNFYEENKLMIIPGVDLTKKATVDFAGSEAATYVFVEVQAAAWDVTSDSMSFSITRDGETVMQWSVDADWDYLDKTGDTYVYYQTLVPNTALDDADIIANDGKITVSAQITKNDIASMTGIGINLRATAVQLGGFDGPKDAWNSVSAKEG